MADWIAEPNIAQSRRSAQNFWATPQGGYGSGWGGGLAAALSGLGYGLMSSDANAAETSNQGVRKETMQRAAAAPDNMSLGKLLMESGVPGMDEKGLGAITSERSAAAGRASQERQAAASRAHAERMLGMQKAAALEQARAMMQLELQKTEAITNLKARLEREQLSERMRMLGLSQPAAAPVAPVAGMPDVVPDVAMPVQGNMPDALGGAAPQPPAPMPAATGAIGSDAERQQRARQALALGDEKLAAKILTETAGKDGNKAYDEAQGKDLAKAEGEIRQMGMQARSTLDTLTALKNIVASGQLSQGPGSAAGNFLRRVGAGLGVDSARLNNTQLFEAITSKLALANRADMPGAMSDADRQFLVSMVPNLGNTKDGNLALIDFQSRVAKRNMEVSVMAERYKARNGGRLDGRFYGLMQEWSSKNPLFTEQDRAMASGPGTAGASGGLPQGWGVRVR